MNGSEVSNTDASAGQASEVSPAIESAPAPPAFPDTPMGYEVRLPGDFALPDGIDVGDGLIKVDDPRIANLREFAHANQLTQEQFEKMVGLGAQMEIAEHNALREAMGRQIEALGPKAQERIGAVKQWVAAKLPADQAESLLGVLFTARQIEAMETLMRLNRGAVPGNPGAGRDIGRQDLSDEEWDKMSAADRITYARETSPRR
ncbi:hypothetical protein EDE05_102441 [Neorhizobium sp. R1-B]|uniref:hypothetical protein n=1 Tax=Neorhizobium sp. R1-B TaxID=2485162 RepID=UPI00106598BC|nr:hypothetical protein [Neorhizobium sp. R1-B]TDX88464.1 hypothetical protein EDE05_102441 [Neorhizobium sp. R1-B]